MAKPEQVSRVSAFARLSDRKLGCLIVLATPFIAVAAAALFFALVGLCGTAFHYMTASLGF